MIQAHLEITDWSYSLGGEHYNGKVTWTDKEGEYHWHELEYSLSASLAKQLNRKDGDRYAYKKGEKTNRYFTEDDLIDDAIQFATTNGEIDLLTKGSGLQPSPVLYCGIEGIRKELTEIGNDFEELYRCTDDPWSTYPEEAEALEERWNELLASHK